jgi:hypothetical protein
MSARWDPATTQSGRTGSYLSDEAIGMTHEPEEEGGVDERFEYFMLRLTRSASEPDRVTGLIERLGSGQKRSFDTGEQLVRLVGGGFSLDQNMQPAISDRNAVERDTRGLPGHDAV